VSTRPVLLVTNDDGIHAPGLEALAEGLSTIGDVWVVAPREERSAASHALSLRRPIRVERLDERRSSVDGTPADSVLLAVSQLLPVRPSLVAAGINHGPNLGDDVNYSGTVAAAMEATILGIPALAVSLANRPAERFGVAVEVGVGLARRILARGLPRGAMLNVNVPDLERERILGVKVVRLARRTYEDMIAEEADADGAVRYRIGNGRPLCERADDTDCAAIEEGWVTVTPLRLDMTHHAELETIRGWALDLPELGRVP